MDYGLGLENQLDTCAKFLSGGQRQALTLYMATNYNPKLLLLDEHTAALDPKTQDTVMKITNKIVTSKKITTLMITHNLKTALEKAKVSVNVNGSITSIYVEDGDNSSAGDLDITITDSFMQWKKNYIEMEYILYYLCLQYFHI